VEPITRRTGWTLRAVAADCGYGAQKVEETLHEMGLRTVVIPAWGRPGKARQGEEHRRVPPNGEMANRDRRQDQHPSAATDRIEPASTAPKEPESGPDTGVWQTA